MQSRADKCSYKTDQTQACNHLFVITGLVTTSPFFKEISKTKVLKKISVFSTLRVIIKLP